jgi:hypothetical protein
MTDKDGPVIANTFYEELFSGLDEIPTHAPDVKKPVCALHLAVKKSRSKNISFRRWVPFVITICPYTWSGLESDVTSGVVWFIWVARAGPNAIASLMPRFMPCPPAGE